MKFSMRLLSALVALFGLVAICNVAAAAEDPDKVVRICDIKANQAVFIGKVVTIDAIYSTDSMVYSFFEDPTCQTIGMLHLGFKVPERGQSVTAFEAAKADYCRKHDMAMCLINAKMRVRGVIAETVGAHLAPNARYLVINLHSVLSYEFIAGR